MKKTAVAGLAAAGILAGGCASTAHQAPTAHEAAKPATPAPTTSAPATPNPSGTGSGSCDYTLSDSAYGDDYLTAEVDLTNTGNVGTVVRVTVKWPQEGYGPIRSTKTVRTPYGTSDVPVHFHVSAGSTASGSNIIDNLQSWIEGHNYPSNPCDYKLTILRSYGPAH